MSNAFTVSAEQNNKAIRNTISIPHSNNLTMSFGAIYPIFIREMAEGESLSTDALAGIRSFPTVFPITTPIRVYTHFFYVRNRTLWKDWQDFKFGTKSGLASPYLSSRSNVDFHNGSLSDHLGLPTTIYGDFDIKLDAITDPYVSKTNGSVTKYFPCAYISIGNLNTFFLSGSISAANAYVCAPPVPFSSFSGKAFPTELTYKFGGWLPYASTSETYTLVAAVSGSSPVNMYFSAPLKIFDAKSLYYDSSDSSLLHADLTGYDSSILDSFISKHPDRDYTDFSLVITTTENLSLSSTQGSDDPTNTVITPIYRFSGGTELGDLPGTLNPFLNGKQPISALPFRAYEAIYNAYYRNQQNDPFKINGETEYNKYVTTDAGGEDTTEYALKYRNWESDVFTSCMPSPQQGLAPKVGVVTDGVSQTLAFSDDDGNIYHAKPILNAVGNGISSFSVTSVDAAEEVLSIGDAAQSGITINDFRNVNALQKWLEMNQRKGYRYKDLIKGHYNVDVKYDELMMPEFIGGMVRDISVNSVTSTSATSEADLGEYAGQLGLVGQCSRITKYCDEAGFIIGVCSIVPTPVYTQTLPKYFTKFNKFDYFFPEFANIGYQAIKKSELCPLQWFNQTEDTNEVFGYNRPWYEYVSALDEAHGDFRLSLRDFLINRVFDGVPTLGSEFLHVNPKHLNDIFYVRDKTDDKFIAEFRFNTVVKTPVPYVHIPRLD
jgi:hypothetical protein